ncbi:hypothetical protein BDP27DRAFT_271698 [Rhodocollybia butyracea]|uniref:Uncharacterized protein n=1 Tax=Rhodocollybia butyracea TaxID=206335 RepID=A0A9P5Q455_9AGAR|nr:hypothetical protein BDP27DRAFT_271698 [Rhodocollybia butyracea]
MRLMSSSSVYREAGSVTHPHPLEQAAKLSWRNGLARKCESMVGNHWNPSDIAFGICPTPPEFNGYHHLRYSPTLALLLYSMSSPDYLISIDDINPHVNGFLRCHEQALLDEIRGLRKKFNRMKIGLDPDEPDCIPQHVSS